MAEIGLLEIDPDNYEDRNIYNSICSYARVIFKNIQNISICSKDLPITISKKRDLNPKTVVMTTVQPQNLQDMDTGPLKFTRTGTQIISSQEHRIMKIKSGDFSKFLDTSNTEQLKDIKEVNRQIILKLQSLSEHPARIINIKKMERSQSGSSAELSEEEEKEISDSIKLNHIKIQNHIMQIRYETDSYPESLINYPFNSSKTELNYIDYDGRLLVVLPIPNDSKKAQIIFNSNGKWCPNGGVGPGYPESKNCPFYKSTGKSNETNFPGMWFPFFRIKTSIPGQKNSIATQDRGWIYKAWGLQSVKQLRERLYNKFPHNIPETPIDGKESSDFLYCFFEKFSHWWQIQLSLQLPIEEGKTLWDTSEILTQLKHIVRQYDYDHFGGNNCFIPIKTENIVDYRLSDKPGHTFKKSTVIPDSSTITIDHTPDFINKWLRGPDGSSILCVEDTEEN